ncbi:hypothetical protein GCM10023340_07480 [Nocardioides marinquilinus]|uniref:Septum formation-related domain-containing protein n=1 Tax=Nocardioides marinquilinus TaxID=1210400 RepID=A0ABP9PCV8_9ACTN
MTRTLLRALACLALALGVTSAVLTAPVAATPAPATGASTTPTAEASAAGRPKVGSCHALTYEEGGRYSDPDAPVPCRRSHTSRTVKVFDVSRSVVADQSKAFDAGIRGCAPAIRRALGGSRKAQEMSAYNLMFFAPTAAQRRAGARWIRCDLTLLGGSRLLPLPTDRTPALGALPHPDRVARCGDARRAGFYATACSAKHDYRAKNTLRIPSKTYPGRKGMLRIAGRRCPAIVGSRTWYASWPSAEGWRLAGERLMVCYRKTTR